ncbi:hypothetical protein [uncultured Clostridium sp.]|uniref:DUF7922 domain-containing protein n=1 Tax=uncultured Clostridium sp. TaxID=59620 RepID=UPI0028E1B754|nr:hypothetical protein [uncultured Clostridium sp.]
MAQKKSYSRYFIILNEEVKGYAIASDKLPTGYVKLEIKNNKCKVSYYVQNLKKESIPYYMILILGKKDTNKLIKIGELNIDDYGRADISYEYPSDNIGDTGMDIENVSGAAIVKLQGNDVSPVLNGFLTSDIPAWKQYTVIEPQSRDIPKEERAEPDPVSIFDKYEEVIEEKVKVEKEDKQEIDHENTREENESNEDKIKEKVDDEIQEIHYEDTREKIDVVPEKNENEEDVDVIIEENIVDIKEDKDATRESEDTAENNSEEIVENIQEDNIVRHSDEHKHEDDDEKMPKGKVGKFFKELGKDFEKVEDEIKDIKRCIWHKVPITNKSDMGCHFNWNKHCVIYQPMINYYNYIIPHKYYMVGYKCDKEGKMKYLVYGIPGSKSKRDQPFSGKTGFVTWVPSNSGKCEGYWLMFYDFKTSTILIPVK